MAVTLVIFREPLGGAERPSGLQDSTRKSLVFVIINSQVLAGRDRGSSDKKGRTCRIQQRQEEKRTDNVDREH